jgi:hypothetical protein
MNTYLILINRRLREIKGRTFELALSQITEIKVSCRLVAINNCYLGANY